MPPSIMSGPARRAGDIAVDDGETARVYIRVRPPNQRELDLGHRTCISAVDGEDSLKLLSKPEPKTFTFDSVATEQTTQEQMFRGVGKPMVDSCLEGYNGAIFVYGQTGSGKTYTMHGDETDADLRGMVPRTLEYLFQLLAHEERTRSDGVEFLVKCSFLEIYNEHIYDLLSPDGRSLPLREDIRKGQYVEDLQEEVVTSPADAHTLLEIGVRNRTVGSTAMNRESSRSHSVFTLVIEQKLVRDGVSNIKTSRLNLVDLAGSERQKSTDTAGAQLKEASKINKSLSVLGNVIMGLVDQSNGKSRHIPYRDSKLTFLLKDSLGGNARTCIIANISPSDQCFGETLSTLKFAQRAKFIRNKAVVNEDATGSIADLQAEIRRLKAELEDASSRPAGNNVRQALFNHPGYEGKGEQEDVPVHGEGDIADSDTPEVGHTVQGMQTRIHELEVLLLRALNKEQSHAEDTTKLTHRLCELEDLYKKKDAFSQSQKMVVKFRESEITRLRKKQPYEADERCDALVAEMAQLKKQIELNPEVARVHIENQILQERLGDLDDGTFQEKLEGEEARAIDLGAQVARLIADKHTLMEKVRSLAVNGQLPGTPSKPLPGSPFKASDPLSRVVSQSIEGSPSAMSPRKRAEVESTELASIRLKEKVESLTKSIAERDNELAQLRDEVTALSSAKEEASKKATEFETALETYKVSKNLEIEGLHSQLAGSADAQDMIRKLQDDLEEVKVSYTTAHKISVEQKGTITDLEDEISTLKGEVEVATALKTEIEANVGTLQAELAELKPKLKREQQAASDYRTVIEDSEARVLELESALDKLEGEFDDVTQQLKASEEERDTLQETHDFVQNEVVEKQTALREANDKVAELSGQVETLENRLDSYSETINSLKSELENQGVQSAAAEEVHNLQNLLSIAEEARASLTDKVASLESDVTTAQASVTEHEGQVESLNAAMADMQAMVADLRSDLKKVTADYNSELARATAMQTERDSQAVRVAAMDDEMEQMRDELQTAVNEHHQEKLVLVEEHTAAMDGVKKDLDKVTGERDAVQELLESLNSELGEMGVKQDEALEMAKSLRAEKSGLQASIASLTGELNEATRKHAALQQALDSQDTGALEATLAESLQRVSELEATSSSAKKELESAKAQINVYRQKEQLFTQLSTQWEVTRGDKNKRIDALEKEVTKLVNELQAAEGANASERVDEAEHLQIQTDLSEARKTLQASREGAAVLKKENATLKAEVESLKASVKSGMEDREEWLSDIKKLRAEEKSAWDECIQLRDELDSQTRMVTRMAKKLKDSEKSIRDLSAQNAKLAGHQNLKQKIQHVNHLKEENNALLRDKSELMAAKRKLEAVVKTLQSTSSKENQVPIEQLMSQANAKMIADEKTKQSQDLRDKQVTDLIDELCAFTKQYGDAEKDSDSIHDSDAAIPHSIEEIRRISKFFEETHEAQQSTSRLLKVREDECMMLRKELQIMKDKSTNAIFV